MKFVFFLAENKPEFCIFRLVRVRASPSPSCRLYEPEANWRNGGIRGGFSTFLILGLQIGKTKCYNFNDLYKIPFNWIDHGFEAMAKRGTFFIKLQIVTKDDFPIGRVGMIAQIFSVSI